MLEVLAGDWKSGSYAKLNTSWGKLSGLTMPVGLWKSEKVSATEIVSTELVTEENRFSILKKAGWTLAGGFLLGPFGSVLGFWKGGERKDRVVLVQFRDGRKAVLCGKLKYVSKLLGLSPVWTAALAKATASVPSPADAAPSIEPPTIEAESVTVKTVTPDEFVQAMPVPMPKPKGDLVRRVKKILKVVMWTTIGTFSALGLAVILAIIFLPKAQAQTASAGAQTFGERVCPSVRAVNRCASGRPTLTNCASTGSTARAR